LHETDDISLRLLNLLRQAKDYISGEEISEKLAVSRTAIWKRIGSLKKEGFIIEASTKKGYRLIQSEDMYGKVSVQSMLLTRFMGRNLKFFHEVDSTNNVLKKLAADNAPEGTTVISDIQTAGRGRRGRTWMSAPGLGIWMSVLLKPNLHPSQVQTLTLASSVAVIRALESLDIEIPGIKWPNDILIGGKKVCGILTELSAEAEKVEWVVIGIGLNVNHDHDDFPNDIKDIATSLRLSGRTQEPFNRSEIAAGIINELEAVYMEFLEKGPGWVAEEWKKRNVTLGKRVELVSQTGVTEAEAVDITPDGRLIVRYDDGRNGEVLSGEISLRRTNLTV
jgi:BirA family biotin operon repressor/biotin-[acetyl-CoA-carboxylase] ligase